MDLVGFEPTTSSMPWKRAPNCATGPLTARLASVILRCSGREVKPGMPPEERARIFGQIKSFFRQEQPVYPTGLPMVMQLAELLGSTLIVKVSLVQK